MAKHRLVAFIRYLILFLLVSAIVAAMLVIIGKPASNAYQSPPPAVIIAQPKIDTIVSGPIAYGYLEASSVVPVVPLAQGTLTRIPIQQGDRVSKGQILAEIDDSAYSLQLKQAQAALDAASSAYQRVAALHASGGTSSQNLEQALAQRDASAAQLDLAKLQLGYTQVRAPIDGVVLSVLAEEGSVASSSQPIAVVAAVDTLKITLNIPESWYGRIQEIRDTAEASVVLTAGDQTIVKAAVSSVAPYIDGASKTCSVTCEIQGHPQSWVAGMHAKVQLETDSWGPGPVLYQSDRTIEGDAYVYDETSKTARMVRIGGTAENGYLFAVPDAYKDAWFIVEGQNTVFDGQPVTVVGTYGDQSWD